MKKILSVILAVMTIVLPIAAQESTSGSSTVRVGLEVTQTQEKATTVHRAPMRINVEAYYDVVSNTLEICSDGELDGEVYLYLNGNIIDYSSEINTSFQISNPGLYKVEIIGGTWIAQGYIQI